MVGNNIKDEAIKKFASSPTPPLEDLNKHNNSLIKQVVTPLIGPNKNPAKKTKTNEKSIFKKEVAGNITNSKVEVINDKDAKIAMPAIFFVTEILSI